MAIRIQSSNSFPGLHVINTIALEVEQKCDNHACFSDPWNLNPSETELPEMLTMFYNRLGVWCAMYSTYTGLS